jgi:FkbM family methyltransferase
MKKGSRPLLPSLNQFAKLVCPTAHAYLKRSFAGWMAGSNPSVPAVKRIRGELFWVHPRLLTTDTKDYEPHICRWIIENLRDGDVFFDVGAHCGWNSLKAARRVGNEGKVIAFEPSPPLVNLLSYHQRRNHLRQITVVTRAVSDRDAGTAQFFLLNEGLSSQNSLTIGRTGLPFLESARRTPTVVRTIKLDTFCTTTGLIPNVIKIDVEGAEGMVLRGAEAVLREFHPAVIVSVHPFWLPPGDSLAAILELMNSLGYRVHGSHCTRYEGQELADYLLSK